MTRLTDIAWAAGLYEGEGSAMPKSKNAIHVSLTSTDRDVLDRLQEIAGGSIYLLPDRSANWKTAWRWDLFGEDAYLFLKEIRPYLLSRRGARADEMIQRFEQWADALNAKIETRKTILKLWETKKYSEREIGEMTGTNRSYVNAVRMGKLKI